MNSYTVRDFRTQPRQIREKLAEVHELIITNNGRPSALIIKFDDENLEDVLSSVHQFMAMRATNKLRLASIKNGISELTEEEFEAEISDNRKEHSR